MVRRVIEAAVDKALINHILLIFILVLSVFAYVSIPKEIFPPFAMDKINIQGNYSGASADILDKMVVQNIEDDLKNLNSIDSVSTTIKNGFFSISADIKNGNENLQVLSDVKDIISQNRRDMPSDMDEPIARISVNSIPLVLVAIAGDVSVEELLDRAEELKRDLSQFKDLSDITIRGDSDEELVIRLDPDKLRAYSLRADSVSRALQNLSSIFPVGTIKSRGEHLFITTYNGEKNAQSVADTVIKVQNRSFRIGDIAEVSFELGDESELSHYNGKRNISVNIAKSESGNSIELAAQIRQKLKVYEKLYPSLEYAIYTDTSIWIKNRLNTVFSNIVFGLMLVFIAMLIFVNRGIALVVAMGIPLSFMIGLIATDLIGYSLNMLSLLGALIALGMLVDEAIVVAENIYRHMEEGKSPREAAIDGAVEMFPAVLAATLTTIFAFLPMLMLTGDMGAFIKILPVMITILLLASLFEAFFMLPLHSKDFLRVRKETHATHNIWDALYGSYLFVLRVLLKRKVISLIVLVTTIVLLSVVVVKQSKFQLFPEFDVTQIYITGKVNINNELEDTEKIVTQLEKILLQNLKSDEFSSVTSVIGMKLDHKSKPELGANLYHVFIDLHERAPDNFFNKYINPYLSPEYNASRLIRERSAREIAKDIQEWVEPLRDSRDEFGQMFEVMNVSVPSTGVVAHDIEIGVGSSDDVANAQMLKLLEQNLSSIDGVYGIENDATLGVKELKLRVNKLGQQLGLSEGEIASQLRTYYLKGEYGKMFNERGLVRMRIESLHKDERQHLEEFQIDLDSGAKVSLGDVCDFYYSSSFVSIKKEDSNRMRSVYASFDKELVSASEVMEALDGALEQIRERGFAITIKGEQEENEKTKREMTQAAIIAIFLIFITLVWLFDSLVLPLIVLSTIPLSILGVFGGHMIMGLNMSMPGLIGMVGLAGVVVNDGLLMITFIRKAKSIEDLISLAKTRLRPILMTSITTVLGLMTLIFFASGQAQILQPMAVSLGFGLIWATVLNLIYVPLLYAVIYRKKLSSTEVA